MKTIVVILTTAAISLGAVAVATRFPVTRQLLGI